MSEPPSSAGWKGALAAKTGALPVRADLRQIAIVHVQRLLSDACQEFLTRFDVSIENSGVWAKPHLAERRREEENGAHEKGCLSRAFG